MNEISDEDIKAAKEIIVNMELANAIYVELRNDERLIMRIKMRNKGNAFTLAGQLNEYKEELHGTTFLSTRDY